MPKKAHRHTRKNGGKVSKKKGNQKWSIIKKGLQCAVYYIFMAPTAWDIIKI